MHKDEKTIEAWRKALDDEYRSHAAYRSVIEAFEPYRPFINIVAACRADVLFPLPGSRPSAGEQT